MQNKHLLFSFSIALTALTIGSQIVGLERPDLFRAPLSSLSATECDALIACLEAREKERHAQELESSSEEEIDYSGLSQKSDSELANNLLIEERRSNQEKKGDPSALNNLPELPTPFIIVISSATGRASKYVAKQCGLSNNKAHATGLATMVAVSAGLRKFTDSETSPSKPIDYLLQFTADAVAYIALDATINYLVPAKKEQKSTTAQNQARSQLLTSTQHAKPIPTQPKRMTRVDEKTFEIPSLLPEALQKKN